MNPSESTQRFTDRPSGRVTLLLMGIVGIYGAATLYPPIRPVLRWATPVLFVLWGASRFYCYGFRHPLTVIAGCLLLLGGITRGLFQLVPTSEFAGTVANPVPMLGIFAELFAQHYRGRD